MLAVHQSQPVLDAGRRCLSASSSCHKRTSHLQTKHSENSTVRGAKSKAMQLQMNIACMPMLPRSTARHIRWHQTILSVSFRADPCVACHTRRREYHAVAMKCTSADETRQRDVRIRCSSTFGLAIHGIQESGVVSHAADGRGRRSTQSKSPGSIHRRGARSSSGGFLRISCLHSRLQFSSLVWRAATGNSVEAIPTQISGRNTPLQRLRTRQSGRSSSRSRSLSMTFRKGRRCLSHGE